MRTAVADAEDAELEDVDDVADSGVTEGRFVSALTVGALLLLDGC